MKWEEPVSVFHRTSAHFRVTVGGYSLWHTCLGCCHG